MSEEDKIAGLLRERDILTDVLLKLSGTTEKILYRDFARRYLQVLNLIDSPGDT